MPVAINMPQKMGSPLEGLAAALNIVQSVYGIKANGEALERAKKEQAMKDEQFAMQKQEFQRKQAGEMTGAEFLAQADKYAPAKEGEAGAIKVPVRQAGGLVEYVVKPRHDANGLDGLAKQVAIRKGLLDIDDKNRERQQAEFKKTPQGKLESLPADAKMKIGLIANTLGATTDYEKALAAGQEPRRVDSRAPIIGTFIGDTDITKSQRMMAETIGRLNSGGVIGKEEIPTFMAMLPRAGDSPEMRVKKLADFRQAMEDRLSALGVSASELANVKGYDPSRMGYDQTAQARRQGLAVPKQPGDGVVQDAKAKGAPEVREVGGALYQRVQGGWKRL